MAVTFHETSVTTERFADRVERQRLLTTDRVAGTKVLLDRLSFASGGSLPLRIAATDLAWLQILDGGVQLRHGAGTESLTAAHIAFLPPGFEGTLSSPAGAAVLYAEVPHAARLDPGFAPREMALRVIDWTREPVLDSEHDARKRIYLVTPKLFGTHALKGEMIIYPPGTTGANHHHEGAEHFMYVLQGRGTAYANESPIDVRKGDLIYYADRERHYLTSEGTEEMRFVEFFVPGAYKTIWAPGAPVCTWVPTGRSLSGERPVREIQKHSSALATPSDV